MKTLVCALLIFCSFNLLSQNVDLKQAIKHYDSQNFGIAEKEINQALTQPFTSDEEVASAMYYYFLINMEIYGSTEALQNNVELTEKIAEAYTIYIQKEQTRKTEIAAGLVRLSHLLVDIAAKQYESEQHSEYFYTMDHIALLLETIGEDTGDFIEKLAEDATRLGRDLRAMSYWHQMIIKNHKKEFAYKELLAILYKLEKYDQVDQLLSDAKNDCPNSNRFAKIEIMRYTDKGMKYSALQLAKRVVTEEPNNLDVVYLYGLLSAQHNEHDEAFSSFVKVTRMNEDHFEANRELGKHYYRFSNQEGHLNLALKYFEKAYALEPKNTEVRDLLHSVYLETGNTAKALSLN
ncbi:MAG: hypothetical protein ABJG47_13005 [Ekhidna sp.]